MSRRMILAMCLVLAAYGGARGQTEFPIALGVILRDPESRSFSNGIVSRYTAGPFGQGWNLGWDLAITEEPGRLTRTYYTLAIRGTAFGLKGTRLAVR